MTYNTSHRKCWYDRFDEHHFPDLDTFNNICHVPNYNPKYQVDLSSFNSNKAPFPSQVNIYTDGSKSGGHTGAGFCVFFENQLLLEESFRLPDDSTVFQAKMFAIREAVQIIHKLPLGGKYIKIHVDSQAALLALNSPVINSILVLQVTQILRNLSPRFHPPTLAWTKAHVGTEGNEMADSCAKYGCQLNIIHNIPVPQYTLKQSIQSQFTSIWSARWRSNREGRHTKHFYRAYNPNKTKYVIKLTRKQLGLFIRIISGHNSLHGHTGKFIESIFAKCRFCRESKETFVHFISDCPCLRSLREEFFGENLPDDSALWSVDKLLAFANSPSIYPLLHPEQDWQEEEGFDNFTPSSQSPPQDEMRNDSQDDLDNDSHTEF